MISLKQFKSLKISSQVLYWLLKGCKMLNLIHRWVSCRGWVLFLKIAVASPTLRGLWGCQNSLMVMVASALVCQAMRLCSALWWRYQRGVVHQQNCLSISFFKKIFYLAAPGLSSGMWDLVPQPGIKPGPPALGVWSFSHWTSREVPVSPFLNHRGLLTVNNQP